MKRPIYSDPALTIDESTDRVISALSNIAEDEAEHYEKVSLSHANRIVKAIDRLTVQVEAVGAALDNIASALADIADRKGASDED